MINKLKLILLKVEAKLTIETVKSDIKIEDEFSFFKQIIYHIRDNNPAALRTFIDQLPEAKQKYLRDVLQSQRILVNKEEKKYVARKIIKIKGKKPSGPGNMES